MKTFIVILSAVAGGVFASLPVIENFDSALDTNYWTTSGASIENSALKIQAGSATRTVPAENVQQIRISFTAKITAMPQEPSTTLQGNTSVAFYVNTNCNLVVFNGEQSEETSAQLIVGEPARFDIYCDYSENQAWSISMDGQKIAGGLEFYSPGIAIESVVIANNSSDSVYLDTLIITDDAVQEDDSVPAGWAAHYGLSDSATPANGMTMLENFIAGLDPTDENDVLALSTDEHGRLRWRAKAGRTYEIEWTTDLMAGFTNVQTVAGGDIQPDLESDPSKFYRIRARAPQRD
ncbi:MAG: hypothetical protein WC959_03300 [Kiritimatiellales bacterium]